jgi:hypothetical protein
VQIIVIPSRLAKTRTLNVSTRHLVASLFVALALLLAMTAGLYWVTFRFATDIKVPLVQELVLSAQQGEADRARQFVQQNLNAMAVKLGEMQAQLARLDALGDRLSTLAGIRPQEFRFSEAPGLGGAPPTALPPQNLSLAEIGEKLEVGWRQMEKRPDQRGGHAAPKVEQAG